MNPKKLFVLLLLVPLAHAGLSSYEPIDESELHRWGPELRQFSQKISQGESAWRDCAQGNLRNPRRHARIFELHLMGVHVKKCRELIPFPRLRFKALVENRLRRRAELLAEQVPQPQRAASAKSEPARQSPQELSGVLAGLSFFTEGGALSGLFAESPELKQQLKRAFSRGNTLLYQSSADRAEEKIRRYREVHGVTRPLSFAPAKPWDRVVKDALAEAPPGSQLRVNRDDSREALLSKMAENNVTARRALSNILTLQGDSAGLATILQLDAQGIYGADIASAYRDESSYNMQIFLKKLRSGDFGAEIRR